MALHHRSVYVCWHINLTMQRLDINHASKNQIYTLDHEFPVGNLASRPLQQKCK